MSRPRLPDAERKVERLWIHVTEAEANEVFVEALRAGMSVSEYLRIRLRIRPFSATVNPLRHDAALP